MNHERLYHAVFLPALAVLSFTQVLSAQNTMGRTRHTIIAESGSTAPTGGNYTPFSFQNLTLNARQEAAFDAALSGPPFTTGVFVGDGRTTSTIALGVNPDPAATSFGSVLDPFITRNSAVVFTAGAGDVFRSDEKKIIPLVRVGDPATGGGNVTLVGNRAVNDEGVIAYFAGVSGAAYTQAIFRTDGLRTTTIARDDMAPPTGGRFTSLLSLDMNNLGQVAFSWEMTGGSADHGIFRGDGGHLTPVFVSHQPAAGGGTVEDCGSLEINAHGQVVAICLLSNTASPQGLFVGDGTGNVAIARIGSPAPKAGNYDVLTSAPRLNDRGEVAFQTRLTSGPIGMFRGDGQRTTTLALSGTSAPGTTGTFQSFGDVFQLGNDGRVVFAAKLTTGVGGVDSSNNLGIWTGTSEENLRLVVRTGEVIGGKVLTALPFDSSSAGGRPLQMNLSSVLWRGSFGPVKAVVVSGIPGDDNGRDDEH